MTLITLTYVAALGLGIVWVIYRLVAYIRAEREREGMISAQMISDTQFKSYLSELTARNERGEPAGPQQETESAKGEAAPQD
jgi:hypothetical protein